MNDGREWESPAPLDADPRIDTDRELPSRSNAQVAAASGVIGGPVGLHAAVGRSRFWTPVRAVLLMALVVLAVSWTGKAGCLQQSPVPAAPGEDATGEMRLNWDNQRQYYSLCYTDIVATYAAQRLTPRDLQQGTMPYRTYWYDDAASTGTKRYTDQPVLIGLTMYVAAKATQGWQALVDGTAIPKQLDVVTFFNIAALLITLFWLLAVWATMKTDRRRLWRGALVALSPLVLVHAFTAFDVIPVALVALALLCWSRERVLLAGVFGGLAAAAALYPLLLLPALAVICVRDRRMQDFWAFLTCGGIAWLAVNLPVMVSYPRGWGEFYRTWWQRGVEPDSLYHQVMRLTGWAPSATLLNVLSLTLLAAVIAAVAYLALRAEVTPTLAQLMFLLVAGYLLVGTTWHPQSSLWLVPLAVLAVPYIRLLVAVMVIDALVWVPRMGLFLDPERKWLNEDWFSVAVVIRAIAVLILCAVVVRDLLARTPQPSPPAPPVPAAPYAGATS
ncbi:glycosyltransferase family 87 protein [Gordonia alkaliphila]|uniref:Glycosyltransferase family 87 protein n=1 Tax=Gordonia alkaliphila TaxID=1053547 RepID=A0ABP8ZJH8_9ACTN